MLAVSSLVHPPENVRLHSDAQIEEIGRSLRLFGQTRPVVVDENNVILAGNGMVMAMRRIGMEQAEVLVKEGLTDLEKKELMLVDNKMYNLGVINSDVMFEFLAEIAQDGDFDVPGYDTDMLESLLAKDPLPEAEISPTRPLSPSSPPSPSGTPQTPVQEPPQAPIQCSYCGGLFYRHEVQP